MKRRFSDNELLKMQSVYQDKTLKEMATMFKCCVSTMRSHLQRLGIYKSASWTDEADERLLAMVKSEIRTEDIAKELHRTKSAINQRVLTLRRKGVDIPIRKKIFKTIEDEKRRARSKKESERYANMSPEKKKAVNKRNVELKRLRRLKRYGLQAS